MKLAQLVTIRDYLRRGHKMDALHIVEGGYVYFKDAGERYRITLNGDIEVRENVWNLHVTRQELRPPLQDAV